ncbi:MAG: lysophospholipid acyltransferase family protein [Desulfobacterales bacterium]|nr:lysophospholipid acyltransferase family protein [Desulfobacterales bacterium]
MFRFISHWFARFALCILPWKIQGRTPDLNKFVLIAAPHSSNWDFVFFMLAIFKLKIPVRWMAKHTLFAWPFRWLLIRLGGIPVDRSVAGNTVETMTKVFAASDHFILTIAPSGTRSKTPNWKSGFYHIALQAKVPIVCGYIDYRNKIIGIGPTFHPTGDIDKDMITLQAFYTPFSRRQISDPG